MKINESVLEKVENHINVIFSQFPKELVYHNYQHAKDVRESAKYLANLENLPHKEIILIEIASLFHDTGFLKTYKNHEPCGAFMAKDFLEKIDFPGLDTEQIIQMILATSLPQHPKTISEKILCDADLDNLGRPDFFKNMDLLYQEQINFGFPVTKKEWYIQALSMLQNHHYFTESAKNLRNEGKKSNQVRLQQTIANVFPS